MGQVGRKVVAHYNPALNVQVTVRESDEVADFGVRDGLLLVASGLRGSVRNEDFVLMHECIHERQRVLLGFKSRREMVDSVTYDMSATELGVRDWEQKYTMPPFIINPLDREVIFGYYADAESRKSVAMGLRDIHSDVTALRNRRKIYLTQEERDEGVLPEEKFLNQFKDELAQNALELEAMKPSRTLKRIREHPQGFEQDIIRKVARFTAVAEGAGKTLADPDYVETAARFGKNMEEIFGSQSRKYRTYAALTHAYTTYFLNCMRRGDLIDHDTFIKVLASGNPAVKAKAASFLGEVATINAIPKLMAANVMPSDYPLYENTVFDILGRSLSDDRAWSHIRELAIKGGDNAKTRVAKLLRDTPAERVGEAYRILEEMNEDIRPREDVEDMTRDEKVKLLERFFQDHADGLFGFSGTEAMDTMVVLAGRHPEQAYPEFIRLAADKPEKYDYCLGGIAEKVAHVNRLETVKTLAGLCKRGHQTEINAVQALKAVAGEHNAFAIALIEDRLLKDDTWDSSVMGAIGKMGQENLDAGFEFIKERKKIRTRNSYETLLYIARDLGMKDPARALPVITDLTEGYAKITGRQDPPFSAEYALEEIIEEHPEQTSYIAYLAESDNPLHRRMIGLSLFQAASKRPQVIGPAYAKLLTDSDPEIQSDARVTVISFTQPVEEVYQVVYGLAQSKRKEDLEVAASGLGMHGRLHPDDALERLGQLAAHPAPEVRRNALSSLGHLGELREDKVLELLEGHKRDPETQVLDGIGNAFMHFDPKDKKRAVEIMTELDMGIDYSIALMLSNYALESDEYTDALISYLKAKASTQIHDLLSSISTSGEPGSSRRKPNQFHRNFLEIAHRHPDKVYRMLRDIQERSPGRNNVYVMWTIGQLIPEHPGAPKLLLDTILNTPDASEKYWHAPQSLPIVAKAQPDRVLAAIKPHLTDKAPTWFTQVIAATLPPNRLQKIIDDPDTPERVKTNLHQFLMEAYEERQTYKG